MPLGSASILESHSLPNQNSLIITLFILTEVMSRDWTENARNILSSMEHSLYHPLLRYGVPIITILSPL